MKNLLQSTWVRFALRASLIAAVSLMILCLVLSEAYIQASRAALEQASRSKAEQVASHLDSVIETVFSYTYAVYNDPDVFQWLYKEDQDPYRDIRMTLSVGRYLKSERYLNDIFLFNGHTERIYSSRTGLSTYSQPASASLLQMAQDSRPGLVRLVPFAQDGLEGLTVTYPMSLIDRTYDVRMVLLVSTSAIERNILGESSAEEQLFVVDAEGNCLLGRAPDDLEEILRRAEDGEKDTLFSGWMGSQTLVSSLHMVNQPWTVCHVLRVTPTGGQTGWYLRILAAALCLTVLVLAGALLLWSWRMLSPYDRIVNRLMGAAGTTGPRNKAALLKESVDSLLQNLESLRATLGRHGQTIRGEEWHRFLLTGAPQALQAVMPGGGLLRLCVARMEGYGSLRMRENYTRRVLIRYELEQLAMRCISQASLSADSVDMGDDHLLLIFPAGMEDAPLREALLRFRALAQEQTDISLAISLGDPMRPEAAAVQARYNELYTATYLHFFLGEERIYTQQDYEAYQAMMRPVQGDDALDRLIESLRAGDRRGWDAALNALVDGWRGAPYPDVQFLATLAAHTVAATFSKHLEGDALGEVREDIGRAAGLEEISARLRTLCEQVSERVDGGRGGACGRWQDTLLEVMDFINAHLQDPSLSPDRIAEHAGLSTNYLRKLFKDYYDASLSDYIRAQRMEKAMELLRETRKTVAEVMEYTGYTNRSSFFQAFKRHTHLTPEQYRGECSEGGETP